MEHTSSSHRTSLSRSDFEYQQPGKILLSRDVLNRELSIMPRLSRELSARNADVLILQLSPLGEAEGCPQQCAHDAPAIRLKVHAQFLDRGGYTTPDDANVITELMDTTAAQLAMGLLWTEPTTHVRMRIVHSTIAMLCERLSSLLAHRKDAVTPRFQQWQLAKLADAFLSDAQREITVAKVAARCGLSMCHFSRLFKSTYGMPFRKYLTQERIKQAQAQLSSTDNPIAQVALNCGFADQSCFTRRFTTVTGMSPAAWRRQARAHRSASTLTLCCLSAAVSG